MITIELCVVCNGTGKLQQEKIDSLHRGDWEYVDCDQCSGSGRTIDFSVSYRFPYSEKIMSELTELDSRVHKVIRDFNTEKQILIPRTILK